MARGMNASVSLARAMLILSSCLVFGTLIGLMPHSSGGQNLRSQSDAQQPQQQAAPAGGASFSRPQLPDMGLFSRAGSNGEEENHAIGGGDFVWNGGFAAVQNNQALDTVDLSMDFSFSFEFEGSFSYDYDYYY